MFARRAWRRVALFCRSAVLILCKKQNRPPIFFICFFNKKEEKHIKRFETTRSFSLYRIAGFSIKSVRANSVFHIFFGSMDVIDGITLQFMANEPLPQVPREE